MTTQCFLASWERGLVVKLYHPSGRYEAPTVHGNVKNVL